MEEEIDLKELINIWWKGKYFIIAVTIIAMVIALVGSILFVTPLYRANASIVTDSYNGWIREIIDHPDEKSFIDNSLAEIVIDPNNYIDSVTLDYNDETVSIIAIATGPNLAAEAANKIGLDLLEWLKGYELEKLLLEKREIKDTLVFFIEQLNIVMLEMDGNSEELNQYDVTADFVDTAIDIINEKYGEPQIDILEILIDRKASLQNDLLETSIEISIIKNRNINEDIEQYFYPSSIPQQPYNDRLVTNIFIAGILGLMLSTLIVFIRSLFGVAKGKTR